MPVLEFNYNKTLIYVAIYWIVEISFRLARKLNQHYFNMVDDKVQYEYILVIYSTIGDLLSGFLVLYIYYSSKSQKEKEEEKIREEERIKEEENEGNKGNIDEYKLIVEEIHLAPKKYNLKYLIIIAILEYIYRSNRWIAFAITGLETNKELSAVSHSFRRDLTNTLDIILRYIFSIFILKTKIYKHHKVSIITFSICDLFITVVNIIDYIFIDKMDIGIILYFTSILLLRVIAFPLEHTLIKKFFQENFIFPEKLQFIRGLINSIIVIVLSIILYFSFIVNLKLEFKYIITGISFIISNFIKEFLILKVIYHMSAQSVSFLIISTSIGNSIYGIINAIQNNKDTSTNDIICYVLEILGFFVILFTTLVYDEVIIINKCNLDFYTKKRIIERGEIDATNFDEFPLLQTVQRDSITEMQPESVK